MIPVKVLKNSDKLPSEHVYIFDLINISTGDSVKSYFPQEIKGFVIGKKVYKTIKIKVGGTTKHIFGQQLETGKASLYYYNGKIFGASEVYIFNKKDEAPYYISLEARLKGESQDNNSTGMAPDLVLQKQMNQLLHNLSDQNAFKSQFIRYFFDCEEVANKLKQDWYPPSSISSLFQDYNSCNK